MNKSIANEVLGVFETHAAGKCTRDRALEDAAKIIEDYVDTRPIVGYVKSGIIRNLFNEIIGRTSEKPNANYQHTCLIHQNEIAEMKRILEILNR